MRQELQTVHGVLAALRRRVRRAWTLRGAALVVAAACAAAVASFALDWFLDLPLAVRAVHLALVVLGLFVLARWALVVPLAVHVPESDLAQALEHGVPDLRDRLVSALDFERRLDDASEPESRDLMREVIRDAARSASRLDPGLLVDSRPVRRAFAFAAAAGAVLLAVAMSFPEEFGLWLRRGVLLADLTWPQRTTIHVLDFPEDAPKVVTRGDDLRIVAVAEGVRPAELALHYEELADPAAGDAGEGPDDDVTFRDVRRMYPLEGEEGHYAFDFRAVSASFRFWVTGGDDTDDRPLYRVRTLVPPHVASIAGKVVRPAYAKLPDAEAHEPQLDVLEGSRVELHLTTNMPLASARMVPPDGPASDVALTGNADRIDLSFDDVKRTIEFHLELRAREGQANRPEDDVFRLRVVEDRPPVVRVLFPPSRLDRTPNGIVPLKLVVEDDFQVARVAVDVLQGATPLGTLAVWPPASAGARAAPSPPAEGGSRGETAAAAPATRLDLYRSIDFREFQGDAGPQVKAGDVLHLAVRASDSDGKETAAPDLAVDVLSVEDFEHRLAQRQTTLREELTVLRRNQHRTHVAITELEKAVGAEAPERGSLERGRDLQVDQGRVTNDLNQFLAGIRQVFNAYVLARVGSGPTVERLLPIYEEFLAKPAANEDEVFPRALYAKIVEEKRADRLFDPEVLGALLDIMDLGDRAADELSPAVYESLQSWCGEVHAPAGAAGAHDPAHLARAVERSVELAAKLAEIDLRMQRWEDLAALIEMAQQIRDTENRILEGGRDARRARSPKSPPRSPPK